MGEQTKKAVAGSERSGEKPKQTIKNNRNTIDKTNEQIEIAQRVARKRCQALTKSQQADLKRHHPIPKNIVLTKLKPSTSVKTRQLQPMKLMSFMPFKTNPAPSEKLLPAQNVAICHKTFKNTQHDFQVQLHSVRVGNVTAHDEEHLNEQSAFFKSSRQVSGLKGYDIQLNSTIVFEDDEDIMPVTIELAQPSHNEGSSKDMIKPSDMLQPSHTLHRRNHYNNEKLTCNNSPPTSPDGSLLEEITQEVTEPYKQGTTVLNSRPRRNLLQKEYINYFRKRKFAKNYKRSTNKKRFLVNSLNKSDLQKLIPATAESVEELNCSVLNTIEQTQVGADEWSKLYTSSEINFPKTSDSDIGPMLNQLRLKLPTLNDRDRLEVSFLLSLMSSYPDAPKHLQELMTQRLNLVYIAVMFKWDTALALAKSVKKKSNLTATNTTLSSSVVEDSSSNTTSHHLNSDPTTSKNTMISTNSDVLDVDINLEKTQPTNKWKMEKSKRTAKALDPMKPSQLALEIIVPSRASTRIKNEQRSNVS